MCLTPQQLEALEAQLQATPPNQRVEATVAYVLAHPCPAPPGEQLWAAFTHVPAADDALFRLTCGMIRHAVQWIGSRVCHLSNPQLMWWVNGTDPPEGEQITNQPGGGIEYLASVLQGSVVHGNCDCWTRHEHFHLQPGSAQTNCTSQHNLAHWNPEGDGGDFVAFLRRAYLQGELRIAGNGLPECAQVNDFRSGILAKFVADDQLRAGVALICGQNGCRGDVLLHDHCDDCTCLSHVEKPTWWLWLEGQRTQWACRRCLLKPGCNNLYFQFDGLCPGCGTNNWSPRATQVWIPVQAGHGQSQPTLPDAPDDDSEADYQPRQTSEPVCHDDPLAGIIAQEQIAQWQTNMEEWLQTISDPLAHDIIQSLVLEQMPLADLAEQLGSDPEDPVFRDAVNEAIGMIPPHLHMPPVGEEEV